MYIEKTYVYILLTVKKSPCHPDPGSGGAGAAVLHFSSSETCALIVPLFCLVARLRLQWKLSPLSEGKEFPPSPWKRCLYTFCVSPILTVMLEFSLFWF